MHTRLSMREHCHGIGWSDGLTTIDHLPLPNRAHRRAKHGPGKQPIREAIFSSIPVRSDVQHRAGATNHCCMPDDRPKRRPRIGLTE